MKTELPEQTESHDTTSALLPELVPLQDLPPNIASGIPSPTASTCAQCGKSFLTIRDQWEHFMFKCSSPPEYHCPKFLCSFVSEHSSHIKTHIATMHDKQAKFLLSCLDYWSTIVSHKLVSEFFYFWLKTAGLSFKNLSMDNNEITKITLHISTIVIFKSSRRK